MKTGKHRAPKGAKQDVPEPRKPEKRKPSRATAALETFHRRRNDPKYNRPFLEVYRGNITAEEADDQILALDAIDTAREIEGR